MKICYFTSYPIISYSGTLPSKCLAIRGSDTLAVSKYYKIPSVENKFDVTKLVGNIFEYKVMTLALTKDPVGQDGG